jgi:pyruvate dehydrogenase E2 component (dihydrolipoamide acetyltransferase)
LAKDVIMPALGMAQETGVLLQWLKAEGDEVTKGEPLMEIETDKTTVEVEAPASGVLANVVAGPGDEIPVGQVIAILLAPGESAPAPTVPQPSAVPAPPASSQPVTKTTAAPAEQRSPTDVPAATPLAARIAAEHNVDLSQVQFEGNRIQKEDVLAYLGIEPKAQPAPTTAGPVLASPKARRLAGERQLDLAAIKGSGPDGAVLAADVLAAEAAAAVPAPAPAPLPLPTPTAAAQTLPISRMWQVAAQRLTQSWTTIPHFYLTKEVNASQLIGWRERVQQRVVEKVTFTDLLVKLVAVALSKHPHLNARWENQSIVVNDDINIGLAVAVDDGLLVPVIAQADRLGLAELAARRKELVGRAKAGKLAPADMSAGTFTLSNLGMFGIDTFNAIVNPPEAAILALGQIAERVVPVEGQPAIQPMMTMTLSCDHRIVDGARGAQFLQTLARFIEEPLTTLD